MWVRTSEIPTGFSPRAQGCEATPGWLGTRHLPQRGCLTAWMLPRWGSLLGWSLTQGNSFLATLGYRTNPPWGWSLPHPLLITPACDGRFGTATARDFKHPCHLRGEPPRDWAAEDWPPERSSRFGAKPRRPGRYRRENTRRTKYDRGNAGRSAFFRGG